MAQYRDRSGRPVTIQELLAQISRAILANVIALEANGLKRGELKMIVGPDGGTVIGREMVFQTPVTKRLSDEDGHVLFEMYRKLLDDYDDGRIPVDELEQLQAENNVAHKIAVIRQKLES